LYEGQYSEIARVNRPAIGDVYSRLEVKVERFAEPFRPRG